MGPDRIKLGLGTQKQVLWYGNRNSFIEISMVLIVRRCVREYGCGHSSQHEISQAVCGIKPDESDAKSGLDDPGRPLAPCFAPRVAHEVLFL